MKNILIKNCKLPAYDKRFQMAQAWAYTMHIFMIKMWPQLFLISISLIYLSKSLIVYTNCLLLLDYHSYMCMVAHILQKYYSSNWEYDVHRTVSVLIEVFILKMFHIDLATLFHRGRPFKNWGVQWCGLAPLRLHDHCARSGMLIFTK